MGGAEGLLKRLMSDKKNGINGDELEYKRRIHCFGSNK